MSSVFMDVNPAFTAVHRFRQRRFAECIDICTRMLEENPYDQAAWLLKTRAMTEMDWIDDTEMEEEGVAELLLDDHATAAMPRPGTSLRQPTVGGLNQSIRPLSSSGRPMTGFARPGTSSRQMSVEQAFQGPRPGTSRPMTALGRRIRLGTASMVSQPGGAFIDPETVDCRRWSAKRNGCGKAMCDYLLYKENNPRKALEVASLATVDVGYKDWWWKLRIGQCYYQLGLLREAERQFKSSLKQQDMIVTVLHLAKVFLKLDQPNTANDQYLRSIETHSGDTQLLLSVGRVHDMMGNLERGVQFYKQVLRFDACNAEAIACIAAQHFYSDQPELALRFYRRMVQMGVSNTELWNNIGLCCFYCGQYDMVISCFERALALADDENMADVWYNVGHIAIGIGDLALAYQALKVAISVDSNHAESHNNLGVLELRRYDVEQAKGSFETAQRLSPFLFESFYNGALLSYKLGDFQESFNFVQKSLQANGEHTDSHELLKQLQKHFSSI